MTYSKIWSDSNNYNSSININWTYTGGTASKDDDFNYKYISTNKNTSSNTSTGSKGSWAQQKTVSFSNVDYSYSSSSSGSGSWEYSNSTGTTISEKLVTTLTAYSFKDIQNDQALSFASSKITKDAVAGTATVDATNVKYVCADYSVATTKFSKAMSLVQFDQIPSITDQAVDFGTLSTNVSDVSSIFLLGDNTIIITSPTGVAIDADAGNDKVTGGIGDDTITAGTGKDTLTGGKGNDTFILNKADYDFTSAKTVSVDSITDFKYVANGEQDSLELVGFGNVQIFNTLAAARTAKATGEVIYELSTGKLYYNNDHSGALVGVLNFATAKGIPDTNW